MHPVFFGSALTGAGVDALIGGIAELLPAAAGDADGPVSGTVFKIERGPAGEKIAYVRMFSGTVRTRDRLRRTRREGHRDRRVRRRRGRPARVGRGRADRQALGSRRRPDRRRDRRRRHDDAEPHHFAPPTLETVVVPRRRRRQARAARRARPARRAGSADRPAPGRRRRALRLALRRGAEGGHPGDAGRRLRRRCHVPRDHDDLHRAAGRQRRGVRDHRTQDPNPFLATVGLRVEPAPVGAGVAFRLEVELGLDAVRVLQGGRGDA